MQSNDPRAIRVERRAFPRFVCDKMQKIARMVHGDMPSYDEFETVPCVDISRTGFSFFRAIPPQWEALVVALGEASQRVFLTAEIVNSEKVERGGHEVYRIGCRFTGRMQLNDTRIFERVNGLESAFILFSGRAKS